MSDSKNPNQKANPIAMALLSQGKKKEKSENPLRALMSEVKDSKKQSKESVLTKKNEWDDDDNIYRTKFDRSKLPTLIISNFLRQIQATKTQEREEENEGH